MRSTILKYIKNLFNKKTKAYLVEREKTDSTPLLSKNAHSEPITTREIRNVSNSKQAKTFAPLQ